MPQTIFSLKKVFIYNVIMWYVTIVACCDSCMRAVLPGRVLRKHNMTIHACFGFIREIRRTVADMKNQKNKTGENTERYYNRQLPPVGRNYYP